MCENENIFLKSNINISKFKFYWEKVFCFSIIPPFHFAHQYNTLGIYYSKINRGALNNSHRA